MNDNDNFALVPKTPAAIEKAEPGTKRVLSGMVTDALALVKKQRRSKPRIVLANDDTNLLQLMESVFDFKEVTLVAFQNGDAAWQELQQDPPDLLITDMRRPDDPMDGWAMIPLLVERNVKYPIIVATALAGYEKIASKPATVIDFQNLIQRASHTLDITAIEVPFIPEEFVNLVKAKLEIIISREFELKWRLGAATDALIAKVAGKFASRITVSDGKNAVDAKSFMALAELGDWKGRYDQLESATLRDPSITPAQVDSSPYDMCCGDRVKVSAEGHDAVAAMEALTELFTCGSKVEHCINPDCSSKPCLAGYSQECVRYKCYFGHTWSVPKSGKAASQQEN